MSDRSSERLAHLWRRLPRALAASVAVMAELSPGRAALALVLTLGFGTTAFVSVASVGRPSPQAVEPAVLQQRPLATASRGGERPEAGASVGSTAQPDTTVPSRGSGERPVPRKASRRATPSRADRPSPSRAPIPAPSPDWSGTSAGPSSPGAEASPTPTGDSPPETTVTARFPDGDTAVFSFGADEPASYSCSLDGMAFTPCDSPTDFRALHPGWHTFAVRATDSRGQVDPTPAEVRWHANAGSSSDRSGR